MEPSGPVEAYNGIALPLPLPMYFTLCRVFSHMLVICFTIEIHDSVQFV